MNDLQSRGYALSSLGERLGIIERALQETATQNGEIWECGSFRGGTALYMCGTRQEGRMVRVFDTFAGLPWSDPEDRHPVGAMAASENEVIALFKDIPEVTIYKGIMPDTFVTLEESVISVAHIDVDQYRSVKEVLAWVYPRVHVGGYIIIDDYNCGDCPGAKQAVDEFLIGKSEQLTASNPQAYFIKR